MPRTDELRAGFDVVIKTLIDHYLRSDRIIWLRLQYLIVIDAAIWAGMYAAKNTPILVTLICLVGVLFTYMMLVIVLGAIEH